MREKRPDSTGRYREESAYGGASGGWPCKGTRTSFMPVQQNEAQEQLVSASLKRFWAQLGAEAAPASSTQDDVSSESPERRPELEQSGGANLEQTAVQQSTERAAGELDSAAVQQAAAQGAQTPSQTLPYRAELQASLAGHDLSTIAAHVGADASRSAERMGAEAFATGEHVVFRGAPTLATTAHEVAHVLQQRNGVQLKGGVGQHGDSYERNADAVAARVVAQQPASDLLAAGSGRGGQAGLGRVQRFGSLEHKSLGDNATGAASYDLGGHSPAIDSSAYNRAFRLTHGDIVMLTGDYFSPRDTRLNAAGMEEPDPDSLFLLAQIPSLSPGQNVGTWDEIVCAIKQAIPDDDRFMLGCTPAYPQGHPWNQITFSDSVIASVKERYLRRAAANAEHFVAPQGGDKGPTAGDRASAGGSYRALHETAILMAYDSGEVEQASAREAAAQHFLTDHFAAGHLRTPRASIREHWRAIYPLFWDNLRNKIALDVARWINDNDWVGWAATVDTIYATIQQTVLEQTQDLPAMGFDDLVSLVAHDFDNENGVWVINDLGISWKLFGDGHLNNKDSDNRTAEMAELAVALGVEDIRVAAQLGASKGGHPMTAAQVLKAVRSLPMPPASHQANKYGAEQVLPRLDPARAFENGTQNWQQPDLQTLWDARVHSAADDGETFGKKIDLSMNGGELGKELRRMATKFPETQDVAMGFTVHPKRAFLDGFLAPLLVDPLGGLLSILHFSPATGQAGFNQDDAVMREINGQNGQGEMTEEQLAGMTLPQKAARVHALAGGFWNWCGEDEGETVVRLFQTTTAGQRKSLYELVEGHAWEGDFKHGWWVADDDMWNCLSSSQLDRLRKIIDG